MSDPPCPTQMRAATACMLQRPSSDWTCTPDGMASIREGLCVAEQEAFTTCIGKLMTP